MARPGDSAELEKLALAAEASLERDDYRKALESATSVLARSKRHPGALRVRAAALCGLLRLEEAEEAYLEACRAAPTDLALLQDAASFFLERGAEDGREEFLERGLELSRRGDKLALRARDQEAAAGFALLEGAFLRDLGEPRAALERFEEALARDRDGAEARLERALTLFELCRFEEARAGLLEVAKAYPDEALVHHTLGLIAERAGEDEESARLFARAHLLDPEGFPAPVVLSQKAFDRAVERALRALPNRVRTYLSNVAIAVEDVPQDDDLLASDPPLSPEILGLFRGAPLGAKASMDPWSHFPSSIVLYQKNLQRFARDRRELEDEIGVTLVHEVGHFLGLDEDELWERGLG